MTETIARTLENVEGMSLDALLAGITWDFESFPEYLAAVARRPLRLNVGAMIGHSPLRLYVMGADASERAATSGEVTRMKHLVEGALDAGALGFASSRQRVHIGAWGRPVPSVLAELSEIHALVEPLRDRRQGVIQISAPRTLVEDFADLAIRTGRPLTWTMLTTGAAQPDARQILDRTRELGGTVLPQISCLPIVSHMDLLNPLLGVFGTVPAFREVFAVPEGERAKVYRDPAWRERARGQMTGLTQVWARVTVEETSVHVGLQGSPSIAALAESRQEDPLDVLCDLALAEDLRTRFRVVSTNDDEDELAHLLRDEITLLGGSDAGAHASQICDAVFATHLLGHWVRERRTLTLEQAVWRLTGHPAATFGISGRGRIEPGFAADLVAFDAETVAPQPAQRVRDLPAGAARLVAGSLGIEHVWVNGAPIRRDGLDVPGAAPGRLIRGHPAV
jgi:N-acyl-D-amino-acid deacylase